MKRLFACILSVTLVLALMIPFASAASVVEYEEYPVEAIDREDIMRMACEAFPEHRENILSYNGSQDGIMTLAVSDEVVVNETKQISDNETLTYIEFSSGIADLLYSKEIIPISSNTGSATETRIVSVSVICNMSMDQFYRASFTYTRALNAPDFINNTGTNLSSCGISDQRTKMAEDSSGRAYYMCTAKFTPNAGLGLDGWTGFFYTNIKLEVGGDSFRVLIDGYA